MRLFGITIFSSKKAYDLTIDSTYHEISFEEIINRFSSYYKAYKNLTKETAKLFTAGKFELKNSTRRVTENLVSRSMIVIDIDNYNHSLEKLEEEICTSLEGYNYLYYSTAKHNKDNVRIRLVIPLEKDIIRSEYKEISTNLIKSLFSDDFYNAIDVNASFSSNYMMYLYFDNGSKDQIFKYVKDKEYLKPITYINKVEEQVIELKDEKVIKDEIEEANNFIIKVKQEPKRNISDEKVKDILELYNASDTDYHKWLEVGQALHHQYEGLDKGYEIFLNWSLKDDRYSENEIREKTKEKYYSFKNKGENPITFASVIKRLNDKKKLPTKINDKIYYPINKEAFLHHKKNGAPKSTYENFKILCTAYNIKLSFDVITKSIVHSINADDNGLITTLKSLMILNAMDSGMAFEYANLTANNNMINTFDILLKEVTWDGIDRINEFLDTVKVEEEYKEIKDFYILTWIKQMLYLALHNEEDKQKKIGRYILVFKGNQGIGKTTWLNSLMPDHLKDKYINDGTFLDINNDKKVINNLRYLICELGELEHSFAKTDINAFKAFFGRTKDVLPVLYLQTPVVYKRTTSFFASINDANFLKDTTGSTRFLIIPVIKANGYHDIDMLQLYKQILETADWINFELTEDQKVMQAGINKEFEQIEPLEEMFYKEFNSETSDEGKHYNATEILIELGYNKNVISKKLTNQIAAILRNNDNYKNYYLKKKKSWKLLKIKENNDEYYI